MQNINDTERLESNRPSLSPAALAWERRLGALKRLGGLCACVGFMVWRARAYPEFWSKTLWALETSLYGVLIASYLRRLPAISPARGPRELLAPYLVAALPFAVFMQPVNIAALPHTFFAGQILLLVGTLLTVTGMLTLGPSFSISAEARTPVLHGVYRWIRHPVYLGELIATTGVALIRLSWLSMGLLAACWITQVWRAGVEEEKLSATFPTYAEYRARKGGFFPRWPKGT